MYNRSANIVSQAIAYIEDNLNDKLELEKIAGALHYSKFHLHRIFTKTIDQTIHEYAQRRQLTEAAKLLAFSKKPIIEIALTAAMKVSKRLRAFLSLFIW